MLLQTNSYIVPKEKRTEHARLLARFRHALAKLGCDLFECYEQTGANWSQGESSERYVQIMRFRDRKHQQQVQAAEKTDPTAQALIKEFCELINFPYQQQQGYFAVGFYTSVLPVAALRLPANEQGAEQTDQQPQVEQSGASDEPNFTDPMHPEPENEVATADFGDVLELDQATILDDTEIHADSPSHPTSDDKNLH